MLREQRLANHLRAEVGAADEPRADVRRNPEDHALRRRDPIEVREEPRAHVGVARDIVELALELELRRTPGRDQVQATACGSQQ